jgi:flagellar hook protein FlgE
MLRSLYSGVSGMRTNQTKMDTIGNNIANVSTTAFKSNSVRFQDMLSQTMSNAQSPTKDSLGGINAQQVGLGVKIGSIDTIMTEGSMQTTNRDLDFAMEGSGFFVVSEDKKGDMKLYTRDGAFYKDYEGNLVNAGGNRVLGYVPTGECATPENTTLSGTDAMAPLSIPNEITVTVDGADKTLSLQSFSIDGNGQIMGVYDDGNSYLLGQLAVSKFNNPEGLEKAGNNNYTASNNSGAPEFGTANEGGFGAVRQGVLEMSNVDLANEFTEMIITSRSYQANSKTITTSDEMLQELIDLKR